MQQLNANIRDIATWLANTEAEMASLKTAKPPSDLQEMGLQVQKLRVSWTNEGVRRDRQAAQQTGGTLQVACGMSVSPPFPFSHRQAHSCRFYLPNNPATQSSPKMVLRSSWLGSWGHKDTCNHKQQL